jgi:Na+/H+ antiporter
MNASLLVVLVVALLLAALARRRQWQAPLLLTVAALAASVVPSVPRIEIDPHLVLALVVPPLLYSTALDTSLRGFKRDIKPIALLGVALVAIVAVSIAAVASYMVPGMSFQTAIVLGAVVAPPDAISAISIGRRLGLPRRLTSIIIGENLVNDATSLTLYRLAIATVAGTSTLFSSPPVMFIYGAVVGGAIGVALAVAVALTRRTLDDPVAESAIGIVVPFVAYLTAEQIQASGVIAVVVAGLLLGFLSPRSGVASRLQDRTLWATVDLILESLVFALIGLQLPNAISAVRDSAISNTTLILAAGGVLLTALVIRPICVFGAMGVYRLSLLLLRRPSRIAWAQVTVLSWSGMRGVLTLAAAAGIPLQNAMGQPFPERDLIQMMAFVVVVGTLLVQGLTMPALIRVLHVGSVDDDDDSPDPVAAARAAAIRIALDALDGILDGSARVRSLDDQSRDRIARATRDLLEGRLIEGDGDADAADTARARRRTDYARGLREVRREVVRLERSSLISERDAGRLDDEDLRELIHELDLQEAGLRPEIHPQR